jgi:hypothetical protein
MQRHQQSAYPSQHAHGALDCARFVTDCHGHNGAHERCLRYDERRDGADHDV